MDEAVVGRRAIGRGNSSLNDLSGYMLVAMHANFVVAGPRFELTLDEIEEFLREE